MSNSRLEKFIYAICGMEVDDLPTPLSRIETLWNCLITGETPDFEPLSRNEKYLMAMLSGDIDGLPEPTSRSEKLLYKIATGETDLSDVPGYLSRYEELLKQLIESGGIGGTDFEYVLYTLNDSFSTLYTTAEGPVKSAILSGQTLVNLLDRNNIGTEASEYTFNNGVYTVTTNRDWGKIIFKPNLATNKKYFLTVNSSVSDARVYYRLPNVRPIQIGNINNSPFIFTTPSDKIANLSIEFPTVVTNGTVSYPMLFEYQDGMEEWDIPYFEGMQSVKMPVLTTCGKNLMPINSVIPELWSGDILNHKICDLKLKPNTSYTFSNEFDGVSNTIRTRIYDDNNTVLAEVWGNQYKTFTTNTSENYWVLAYDFGNGNIIEGIQIEEGTLKTPYEPYKSNILTTTSKNLFDMNRPYDNLTDSQASVVQDTNQITVSSSAESGIYVNANFILDKDFFAGKTVTGSCLYESDEKDIGTVQIAYQDGNGEHHYQWIRTPKTFTFPNSFIGDVMLSVSANNTDTPQSNTVTVKNIQLELGSTATSYEPYSEVVLRGIGAVRDILDGNTGELTQRIGEIVLDGSESFIKYTDVDGFSTCGFYTTVPSNFKNHFITDNTILCDEIKVATYQQIQPNLSGVKDEEAICINSGYIKFRIDGSKATTVEELKTYLSSNPITLVVPLIENIIKTVVLSITDQDGQPTKLSTFNDITHVSIEAEDLLPTVDLEVPTKIEETLSTLPTLMNDILETQQLLNESIDDQAENINEVSTAMAEIRNDIL